MLREGCYLLHGEVSVEYSEMVSKRKQVNEVFTPRAATVNPVMYIARPSYERTLRRSVEGSLHTIVSGESGSGKTWLYKKVAGDHSWALFCGNLGNAARLGSIAQEIANTLIPAGCREWEELIEGKESEYSIGVAKGKLKADRKYDVKVSELVERSFMEAKKAVGKNKRVVLVLDNLEAIFSKPELMEELGNIILLLDDERYAKYGVKILLVGVPSDVLEYYQRMDNLAPVANRLEGVLQVASLSEKEIRSFVDRGFRQELELDIADKILDKWAHHVHYVTLGVAQRVHEYCLELGYLVEDAGWGIAIPELLDKANRKFMVKSFYQSYAVIESCMNDRKTKAGRRNQVLFALGKVEKPVFDGGDVEGLIRKHFPESTKDVLLAIGNLLSELATEERPLLRRMPKGKYYRFSDPRYLMLIRLMLVRESDETVTRRPLRR